MKIKFNWEIAVTVAVTMVALFVGMNMLNKKKYAAQTQPTEAA